MHEYHLIGMGSTYSNVNPLADPAQYSDATAWLLVLVVKDKCLQSEKRTKLSMCSFKASGEK